MTRSANIDSVDVLRALRGALFKFAEAGNSALADAEAEMQRVLLWLETEQLSFWQQNVRKCQAALAKAKEALRMKTIFKDATGRTPIAFEEEKAVALWTRRLAEAEQKLANTKRHARQLQKEIMLYKGGVQGFASAVQQDVPAAAAQLERLASTLDTYISLAPSGTSTSPEAAMDAAQPAGEAASMARPQEEQARKHANDPAVPAGEPKEAGDGTA